MTSTRSVQKSEDDSEILTQMQLFYFRTWGGLIPSAVGG